MFDTAYMYVFSLLSENMLNSESEVIQSFSDATSTNPIRVISVPLPR